MLRLFRIDFRNALFSSETLFGLVLSVACGVFSLWTARLGQFELSSQMILPAVTCVFIAFALSLDNSFGTVRSRIITGYTRAQIFFSKTLAAAALGMVYLFISMLPLFIYHGSGLFTSSLPKQLMILACSMIFSGVLAAVISTVLSSRTWVIIVVLALFLGANVLSMNMCMRLYNSYEYQYNGSLVRNTEYISGFERLTVKLAAYSFPVGQYQLADEVLAPTFASRRKWAQAESERVSGSNAPKDLTLYKQAQADYFNDHEKDIYLVPVYTLITVLLLTSAGLRIYRRLNIS